MKVIFMGTPEFAVPTLEKLHNSGHDICLVVTQPDRPSGRGKKLKKSEVKLKAEEFNLNIIQPQKIKSKENAELLKSYNPDIIVVVAYGQILSKEILELPKYGCINVHASLLPELRGAAPLNWAIITGEKKSGVTTMLMDTGLDTGDMLLKSEVEINEHMTVEELHDLLKEEGADLLIKTIEQIGNNSLRPIKQDESMSSYAPMLDKENTRINWSEKAADIYNKIRGLSPFPGSYFVMDENNVKVYRASFVSENSGHAPGYVLKSTDEGIYIQTGEGILIIEEFQMPGKKRMPVEAYLRGNKFPEKINL